MHKQPTHKHIEWDDPGRASVAEYFSRHPGQRSEPGSGDILSARFKGMMVRIKVAAYVDDTSIGEVVAVVDPASGERLKSFDKLDLGDTVRLPDQARAFESPRSDDESNDSNN